MMIHGLRRAAEMEEVVETLDALGTGRRMSRGTVARQRAIGALGLIAPPAGARRQARASCCRTSRMTMIIDCHGHYTTAPPRTTPGARRRRPRSRPARPPPPYPDISDDEIRETIEANQLRLLGSAART